MVKPSHFGGYSDAYTVDCERVIVTLLRGLGPWKESVFLVGGLTPRYLVPQRPPDVPAHAGTLDVDIVIDLQLLADTDAYHSLEDNLKRMGFERAINEQGLKLSWRWQTRTEHGALMVLELLADAPQIAGGRVQPLPTEGTISALNIPHSSIVFDLHQVTEIRAELLGENGMATERVKHADLVSFTCLKAFAFDQRFERKDAHDLIYCIEHAPDGLGAVVAAFGHAIAGAPSMQTVLVLMGETGFIDSPFVLVKSYRKEERNGRPAVVPVQPGIDSYYKAYRAARPSEVSSEDAAVVWDPARFKSSRMREIFDEARRFAQLNVPVLLLGERGTGKTTLAGWICSHSPYRDRSRRALASGCVWSVQP